MQYVLVGSGYVMVGSTVCDGGKWECSSSVEGGGRRKEKQLRRKSNDPNLKGGEQQGQIGKRIENNMKK